MLFSSAFMQTGQLQQRTETQTELFSLVFNSLVQVKLITISFPYFWPVSVCTVWVYACMCTCSYVCVCMCMWRPESDTVCLSRLLCVSFIGSSLLYGQSALSISLKVLNLHPPMPSWKGRVQTPVFNLAKEATPHRWSQPPSLSAGFPFALLCFRSSHCLALFRLLV